MPPGTEIDPLPPTMLRKYITYARKYCFPKIGEAARNVLEEFYISLRERRRVPLPIGPALLIFSLYPIELIPVCGMQKILLV